MPGLIRALPALFPSSSPPPKKLGRDASEALLHILEVGLSHQIVIADLQPQNMSYVVLKIYLFYLNPENGTFYNGFMQDVLT